MPSRAQQSMLFPDPGGHSSRMLCRPVAAIIRHRFARACPAMDSKGTRIGFSRVPHSFFAISTKIPFSKNVRASFRQSAGTISIPSIHDISSALDLGTMTREIPCLFAEMTNGRAPSSGRSFPSSASSPRMRVSFSRSSASRLSFSRSTSPAAIARSKWLPVFLTWAGARLIVTRFRGNDRSEFLMADRILSRLSWMDASQSPTIVKLGIPGCVSISMSMGSPWIPWSTIECKSLMDEWVTLCLSESGFRYFMAMDSEWILFFFFREHIGNT